VLKNTGNQATKEGGKEEEKREEKRLGLQLPRQLFERRYLVRKFLYELIVQIILIPGNIRLWFREKKKNAGCVKWASKR